MMFDEHGANSFQNLCCISQYLHKGWEPSFPVPEVFTCYRVCLISYSEILRGGHSAYPTWKIDKCFWGSEQQTIRSCLYGNPTGGKLCVDCGRTGTMLHVLLLKSSNSCKLDDFSICLRHDLHTSVLISRIIGLSALCSWRRANRAVTVWTLARQQSL